MFEKLIKELKGLKNTKKISVPVNADSEGYLDKECPKQECQYQFKVEQQDWNDIFKDEKVYCPYCRHMANSDHWWTIDQITEAREQIHKYIEGRINNALVQGARDFNSKQHRDSFISMSVTVKGTKPYHYILPIPAKTEMTLKVQCKECNARYAVIGSAFFCPSCGHNSVEETFDNSLKKIENKIKNIPIIRKSVEEINRDEAETTCRSLIETSMGECVVAFQRYCEMTFSKKSPSTNLKFNAFQNLEMGGEYWRDLLGETYKDWLSKEEFVELNILFQKRHLLSHTEGIVDQKYLDKSGDFTYRVGQRIIIKEKDILKFIELIKKLTDTLKQK